MGSLEYVFDNSDYNYETFHTMVEGWFTHAANEMTTHHPMVQGYVHDLTKSEYYRYTVLLLYLLSGVIGATVAWVTIIYL